MTPKLSKASELSSLMPLPGQGNAAPSRKKANESASSASKKGAAGSDKGFADLLAARSSSPSAQPAPNRNKSRSQPDRAEAPRREARRPESTTSERSNDAQETRAAERRKTRDSKKKGRSASLDRFSEIVGKGQAAAKKSPALKVLTGDLAGLDPTMIPGIVAGSSFITEALKTDVAQTLEKPSTVLDLIRKFDFPKSVERLALGEGLDLAETVSPADFLKAIGIDPHRISAELTRLKDTLPASGLAAMMPGQAGAGSPLNRGPATAAQAEAALNSAASQANGMQDPRRALSQGVPTPRGLGGQNRTPLPMGGAPGANPLAYSQTSGPGGGTTLGGPNPGHFGGLTGQTPAQAPSQAQQQAQMPGGPSGLSGGLNRDAAASLTAGSVQAGQAGQARGRGEGVQGLAGLSQGTQGLRASEMAGLGSPQDGLAKVDPGAVLENALEGTFENTLPGNSKMVPGAQNASAQMRPQGLAASEAFGLGGVGDLGLGRILDDGKVLVSTPSDGASDGVLKGDQLFASFEASMDPNSKRVDLFNSQTQNSLAMGGGVQKAFGSSESANLRELALQEAAEGALSVSALEAGVDQSFGTEGTDASGFGPGRLGLGGQGARGALPLDKALDVVEAQRIDPASAEIASAEIAELDLDAVAGRGDGEAGLGSDSGKREGEAGGSRDQNSRFALGRGQGVGPDSASPLAGGLGRFGDRLAVDATLQPADGTQASDALEGVRSRLIERIQNMTRPAMGSATSSAVVNLSSAELGPLTVAVQVEGDRVRLRIASGSEQVRNLIAGDLGHLQESLANQNLRLEEVASSDSKDLFRQESDGSEGFDRWSDPESQDREAWSGRESIADALSTGKTRAEREGREIRRAANRALSGFATPQVLARDTGRIQVLT